MKKLLSVALSTLLLISALAGGSILAVSAEGEGELPTPTFSYDFSKGFDGYMHPSTHLQVSYENAEGYVTFKSEGDDPYFQFADEHQPTATTEKMAYAIIKYRTTAAVSKGESFTNRHSGPQWGADGTHVEWNYINDGQWHVSLIDNTGAWGSTAGDTLYAYRLDPLATGAVAGDTIDIEFIHFFADKDSAIQYAITVSPDDAFYLLPRAEHTVKFMVDDRVIYTVTFLEGDTKLSEIPAVPNRPGCDGVWEAFELGNSDIEVKAVYTPKVVETQAPDMPDMPDMPDIPDMPDMPEESETVADTLPTQPVETDPMDNLETNPVTDTETLPESEPNGETVAETSSETRPESDTVAVTDDESAADTKSETEGETQAETSEGGCGSTVALVSLLALLPAVALTLRRKDD